MTLIGRRAGDKPRAVSPVVAVILMVAVTVILSTVVATFVLDLGQSTNETAQAGVSVDETSEEVEVTYVTDGNVDRVIVDAPDSATVEGGEGADGNELSSPGQTVSVSGLSEGESVTVIGVVDGKEQVLQTHSVASAKASMSTSGTIEPTVE